MARGFLCGTAGIAGHALPAGLRPPPSWGYRPRAGEGGVPAPLAPLRGHVVAKREYVPPG